MHFGDHIVNLTIIPHDLKFYHRDIVAAGITTQTGASRVSPEETTLLFLTVAVRMKGNATFIHIAAERTLPWKAYIPGYVY